MTQIYIHQMKPQLVMLSSSSPSSALGNVPQCRNNYRDVGGAPTLYDVGGKARYDNLYEGIKRISSWEENQQGIRGFENKEFRDI